jgi:uncharacterized protein
MVMAKKFHAEAAMSPHQLDQSGRGTAHPETSTGLERIVRGEKNWWFLGPGGLARLGDRHLTAGGVLRTDAERHLRDRGLFTAPPWKLYSLTVLTSTDCNLGCGYCFQNRGQDPTGGSRPPRIAHARLTSDTITSALEFARRQMAAAELSRLHVLLFGGEPLINPRGCAELLARAADYGLASSSMISNATLLTRQVARQLADLGLSRIQVTFDGDREDHDRIRVRRSNGGTFDAIVRNISRACEVTPIRWTLRVNVSHHNYLGMDALIGRLADALDTGRCSIYFARVGDVGVGYGNELLHTGELAARFALWHRRALDLGFSVPRPRAHQLCQTCAHEDGRYGATVNADGTLSSCWDTAGKPGWEVGTVTGGYLPPAQTRPRWVACDDAYQYGDDGRALRSFQDTVDADLLDYLDETGRL